MDVERTPVTKEQTVPTHRSTKKKDQAPRGVFRHKAGVWAARYTCGAGHVHEERVGPLKGDAIRTHAARRQRAYAEPGWCPSVDRQRAREHARAEAQRERRRLTLNEFAEEYLAWARTFRRGWQKEASRLRARILPALGNRYLDEITTEDIERFLASLREGVRPLSNATINRIVVTLGAMYTRALRGRLVPSHPVRGITRLPETARRVMVLSSGEEALVRDALPPALRPLFTVTINIGARWSELARLGWGDVDMLAGTVTIRESKNGTGRAIPLNHPALEALLDQTSRRHRPDDPSERVFDGVRYNTALRALARAATHATATLRDAGQDSGRLAGLTWHILRHCFASRLVMAGVDLRTVQVLGGWRTLKLVERYAHLSPQHLRQAVERIAPTGGLAMAAPAAQGLGFFLDSVPAAPTLKLRVSS